MSESRTSVRVKGGALLSRLAFVREHGLLRRTVGRRTYEEAGENKAVLRTYDAPTPSHHDCLTIVGWHRKAIEMCGGKDVRVTETKCRTKGADVCEYVCEWR